MNTKQLVTMDRCNKYLRYGTALGDKINKAGLHSQYYWTTRYTGNTEHSLYFKFWHKIKSIIRIESPRESAIPHRTIAPGKATNLKWSKHYYRFSQSFCLLYAFVHKILWYNAIVFLPMSEGYNVKLGQSGPGYSSAFGVGPPNFAMNRRYCTGHTF